jgi:hypothetical protein
MSLISGACTLANCNIPNPSGSCRLVGAAVYRRISRYLVFGNWGPPMRRHRFRGVTQTPHGSVQPEVLELWIDKEGRSTFKSLESITGVTTFNDNIVAIELITYLNSHQQDEMLMVWFLLAPSFITPVSSQSSSLGAALAELPSCAVRLNPDLILLCDRCRY